MPTEPLPSGAIADLAPTPPQQGQIWIRQTDNAAFQFTGTAWIALVATAPGNFVVTGNLTVNGTSHLIGNVTADGDLYLSETNALIQQLSGSGTLTIRASKSVANTGTAMILQTLDGSNAAQNVISITGGTSTPVVTFLAAATIVAGNTTLTGTASATAGTLKLINSNASAAGMGAMLSNLSANNASNGATVGFSMNNSTPAEVTFGTIQVNSTTVTAAAEGGSMFLRVMQAGTLTTSMTLPSTGGVRVNSGNLGVNVAPATNNGILNSGTVTASSIAYGYRYIGTLAANANGDTLFGIDLNGAYTVNAKTGVSFGGIFVEANSTVFDATSNKYGILIGAVTGANGSNIGIDIGAPSGATTNIGLRNAGTSTLTGNVTIGAHLIATASGAPGTSNKGANVTSVTFTGNDVAGSVAIVMGGALAANTRIATCTFAVSYGGTAPYVILVNQTSGVGLTIVNFYVSATSTGVSFDIAADQALATGTYTFEYIVIGAA